MARFTAPAPANLAAAMIEVPEGSQLDVDLRLESVVEGVLVTGTVTGRLSGECARCLDPITDAVTGRLRELYVYPDRAEDTDAEEANVRRLDGDLLDLEPTVRDEVVVELPLTPVCRGDCVGLCPGCGARWEDLPDDHAHEVIDSRWAALVGRLRTTRADGEPADPNES